MYLEGADSFLRNESSGYYIKALYNIAVYIYINKDFFFTFS